MPPVSTSILRGFSFTSHLVIEDDIGLHKIGNASHIVDAVTLHLYSPPIRELTLYEPEKKLVSTRKPGFYSIGGKRT